MSEPLLYPGLHFWDSPDDIHSTAMELVFDKDRMYLHGATGFYGAAPLAVTGDMDLDPARGSYRLQCTVAPGVEINALRATLGVRPPPFAMAGAVRGVLHCTGPLEHPVFSGSASGVRPKAEMLGVAGGEGSSAGDALNGEKTAVAAYDVFPLVGGQAVFTMDTATELFSLHSAQVTEEGDLGKGGWKFERGCRVLCSRACSIAASISVCCVPRGNLGCLF